MAKKEEEKLVTVEEKLRALYELQEKVKTKKSLLLNNEKVLLVSLEND